MGISKALLKLGGVHTSLWFHQRNINVFTDCLKRLYYKSGSLTSVGRLFQTRDLAALNALVTEVGARPTDEKRGGRYVSVGL